MWQVSGRSNITDFEKSCGTGPVLHFKLESGTGCENTFPDGTGSREKERVYVEEVPVAAINSLRRRIA